MTDNQKAALAWARGNDARIKILAKQERELWRLPEERARISETIKCLTDEAARMRAYAYAVKP